MRLLLVTLAGLFTFFAAGCSWMLEPIEQRFLFRPWPSDQALLGAVASRGNGIEEVRVKTPERWGWLFINYRGYGLSGGQPSEHVVLEDASLIYDYAAARPDVDASNIVLLGRSLGTYFAVALAKEWPVRGAILATPFDSFAALDAERFPWLPMGLLLNGRYDSSGIAPTIKVPALFVLAERDDVTPVEHGAALAHAWAEPQRTITLAGARHYGIERSDEFWNAVAEFLRQIESAPRHNGYGFEAGS